MGERTGIRWTDHTFNPIWGCTRVSEACQHCYAEALAARFGTGWGKNAERRTFGEKYWNNPVRWNRKAAAAGEPALVFCASMADVFEDHPTWETERPRLWDLVLATPWLTWQLLTKRPENIQDMVPLEWIIEEDGWPENVWVGTTVETQARADERLPYLTNIPAPVRFVSAEPLFGPLNLRPHLGGTGVNWVIAGGESGPKARPSHPQWFRDLRDDCASRSVPFLFKQWGEWAPTLPDPGNGRTVEWSSEWTEDGKYLARVGKKAAGWVLDGRTHDEIPARVKPANIDNRG